MGDGFVLESGTHSDLVQADGAYARLVQAQKLREGREKSGEESQPDSMEKDVGEDISLSRKNTRRSLASEILEQKCQATEGQNEKQGDYGLFYIFKRMVFLVRDQWRNYFFGVIFACRK